jgi:hypothetical protein
MGLPSARTRPFFRPQVEELEDRLALSAASPSIVLLPAGSATPFSGTGPGGGWAPSQIRHAYGFDQITFQNGTIPGDGTGETIAIIDAYNDPNLVSDLHTFDQKFGLSDPSLTVVNQTGGSTLPPNDTSPWVWAEEMSLDVEWSHAIAQKANILVVEATTGNIPDLLAAVDYARHAAGVVAVSMSWGFPEFTGEANGDSFFTTPNGHGGVTFVCASGDNGGSVYWPAISSHVVSVGGTAVTLDASDNWLSEVGWSGSSGGLSTKIPEPSYQKSVVPPSITTTWRTNPDVAFDALHDPANNIGLSIYDSYNKSGWLLVGGTSVGAPCWAALIAIADQGRGLNGLGSLDSFNDTLPALYRLPSADFHDITSGGNGKYSAGPGYDLVTGRGTPLANLIATDLSTIPSIGAVSYNDGNSSDIGAFPNQRSMITQVVLTFNTQVTLDAGAIAVNNLDGSGFAEDLKAPVIDNSSGHSVVTVTFQYKNGDVDPVTGGSLQDGNYRVTVDGTKVHQVATLQTMAGNYKGADFYRWFGDVLGDKPVGNGDALWFRKTFNLSSSNPAFIAAFAFDGGTTIGNFDALQFRKRFNTSPPAPNPNLSVVVLGPGGTPSFLVTVSILLSTPETQAAPLQTAASASLPVSAVDAFFLHYGAAAALAPTDVVPQLSVVSASDNDVWQSALDAAFAGLLAGRSW